MFRTCQAANAAGRGLAPQAGTVLDFYASGGYLPVRVQQPCSPGVLMMLACPPLPWPPRVLIVEDESIIALATKANLKRMGCEVVATAATGQQAVDFAVRTRPDVVLMDIMLEGAMDGIEAAARIRESRPDLPIIYCTAYTDDGTRSMAEHTKPRAFMGKPLDYVRLKTLIDDLQ